MTTDRIEAVLASYVGRFSGYGTRQDTDREADRRRPLELAHWACYQGLAAIRARRPNEAARLLGFVQGLLWMANELSLDAVRLHASSPEPVHDKTVGLSVEVHAPVGADADELADLVRDALPLGLSAMLPAGPFERVSEGYERVVELAGLVQVGEVQPLYVKEVEEDAENEN